MMLPSNEREAQGVRPDVITVRPLTPQRWHDLETLFRARGCSTARGCWCMYYRIRGTLPGQPGDRAGDAPKRAMRALVDGGTVTGLIGYETGVADDAPVASGHLHELPVGWVSLGPREQYEKLRRSPVMCAVDDEPVWSVVCFVVPSEHRGRGVTVALLRGAIDYAREQGAGILEAYPVDRSVVGHASAAWFGSEHMFAEAGFEEVARRRADRPIMRLWLR